MLSPGSGTVSGHNHSSQRPTSIIPAKGRQASGGRLRHRGVPHHPTAEAQETQATIQTAKEMTGAAMKLSSTQLEQTLSQFEAEVLPDNHPAFRQLNSMYGDHTFLLDGSG